MTPSFSTAGPAATCIHSSALRTARPSLWGALPPQVPPAAFPVASLGPNPTVRLSCTTSVVALHLAPFPYKLLLVPHFLKQTSWFPWPHPSYEPECLLPFKAKLLERASRLSPPQSASGLYAAPKQLCLSHREPAGRHCPHCPRLPGAQVAPPTTIFLPHFLSWGLLLLCSTSKCWDAPGLSHPHSSNHSP